MMDSRRFWGSFEHDFCSCGRQRNGCFQKFACAELNLFWFLLIVVYLSREEFDCQGGGLDWEISLSNQTLLSRVILGMLNSIGEFLFQCLKSKPRAGAGEAEWGLPKLKRFLSWKLIKHCYQGVDSWGSGRTRLMFNLPVTRDIFMSAVTVCWTHDA